MKSWLARGANLAASITIGSSLWWLGSVIADSESFPGPLDVILTAGQIVLSPVFALSFVETIWMSLAGLLLGLIASYAAALLMSVSSFLETSLWPTLNFLRSIPTIVLLPLFLVMFGIGINAVIIITAFGTFSKLVIFALDGIRSKSRQLEDVSELSSFSWLQKFLVVQLPISAQFILSGLQLSMSRAYGLVILSGLLIGAPGLGKNLRQATSNARYEEIFAYGLILAILGVLLYMLVLRFESKLLRSWGVVN